MNVLALDTCFGAVSVAARWRSAGEWQQLAAYEEMQSGHAERLMPMIAEVMQAAGRSFAHLDRIAVTRGPGSFTGVRVGVAAARGLALATRLPVVAATSLQVMGLRADRLLGQRRQSVIAVSVDARRGGLYVQLLRAGTCEEVSEAEVLSPVDAARRVASHDAIVVGSGGETLMRAVADAGLGPLEVGLPELQPHAADLALLAAKLAVGSVSPLYLRAPDAKPQAGPSLPRAE